MKYVVSWMVRPTTTVRDSMDALKVFEKWAPDPAVTFHQFVQRCDGRGGYAVVETDNPGALLRDASMFGGWFDFECQPVMDMMEAAPVSTEVAHHIAAIIG